MLYLIIGFFMLVGFIVQARLKSKFKKYSEIRINNGLTGREIAEKMLHDHQIYDVKVISTPGKLTDHYNPADKTINLSEDVYQSNSIAAAAVAAHECGHAVQHAKAYKWLTLRSALVPAVNFSSRMMNFIFIAMLIGAFGMSLFSGFTALLVITILQSILALFTVITLPVEYDASNRALAWLEKSHMTTFSEQGMAKDALNAAANTYLVAALAALTQVAYYILLLLGNRD